MKMFTIHTVSQHGPEGDMYSATVTDDNGRKGELIAMWTTDRGHLAAFSDGCTPEEPVHHSAQLLGMMAGWFSMAAGYGRDDAP